MSTPAHVNKQEKARPYVVYWNNIPAPYMVDRFNALAECADFQFEAWFNDRLEDDRSWEVNESSWQFYYRFIPKTRLFGKDFHWPLIFLFSKKIDVLVSLYAEPSFIVGWLLARLRDTKTAFWVEVTFDRWVSRSCLKEWIKRQLLPRANTIITVSSDGKDFAKKYGVSSSQISFAPHTIDVLHYANKSTITLEQHDSIRKQLKLEGTTFIYVGRLWRGKGVNYLLDAFIQVQKQLNEPVSLLLVGDGEDEQKLKQHCIERKVRNVKFTGFKQKEELPGYYAVADIFVFPTLGDPYGLVVDEAMACALPVISTSAAGEIRDRIQDGVNGYIVPPEDSTALAKKMLLLSQSPDLCKQMGRVSYEKIRGNTPQKWAEDFKNIVYSMLPSPLDKK